MSEHDDDDHAIPAPRGLEVQMLAADVALLSFPEPVANIPSTLTASEVEIALSIYAGEGNEEIARKRSEDVKRVSRQISALYRKLGVSSRAELVLRLRGNDG